MARSAAQSISRTTGDDPVLARHGSLEVRLAANGQEIGAAMRLRHAVFSAEMGLFADASGVETDRFDALCDHIVVRDLEKTTPEGSPPVVGTYRALRPEATEIGFYSDAEFDLAPLLARHPGLRFCEVGRSCVARTHRSQPTLEALWRGLFVYAARHGIDVYFGAASFPGTDLDAHAMSLSWLYHNAVGRGHWAADARPSGAVGMDLVASEAIDSRLALRAMPPLLRGYLRIGAHVGQRAFIDPLFGTTDVLVIAPLDAAPGLWRRRFETATATGLGKPPGPVGIAPDLL